VLEQSDQHAYRTYSTNRWKGLYDGYEFYRPWHGRVLVPVLLCMQIHGPLYGKCGAPVISDQAGITFGLSIICTDTGTVLEG